MLCAHDQLDESSKHTVTIGKNRIHNNRDTLELSCTLAILSLIQDNVLVSEDVRDLTLADFSTASVASAGQSSEGRVSLVD